MEKNTVSDILFNIIMPVYNSEKWISKSIESVVSQDYTNWKLIVLEDCSTDNTMNEIMKFKGCKRNIVVRQNGVRKGPVLNQYTGIREFTDQNSIIVHLDGDDTLNDLSVLSSINQVYQNPDIWATYGDYKTLSGAPSICRPLDKIPFRESITNGGWRFSHLRTYKKHLFDNLWDADVQFAGTNKYYNAAADVAIFLPILEMCGSNHIQYVNRINVVYNDANPLSESSASNLQHQVNCALDIQKKQQHKPI